MDKARKCSINNIEEALNPYVKQVSAMEYERGRHGCTSFVADFASQERGKEGVSITEDLLPIGKCCYCGYQNEHRVIEMRRTIESYEEEQRIRNEYN